MLSYKHMKNNESFSANNTGELQEDKGSKVERLFGNIKKFAERIKQRFGVSGSELTRMTDDALVFAAEETIKAADENGERSEEDQAEVTEIVSTVVAEGALEEAGAVETDGDNPVATLHESEVARDDVDLTIESMRQDGLELGDGQNVAELATQAIRRAKWDDLIQTSSNLGSNPGGWHENSKGERYYVKFYKNPSQGQVEYIANKVYAALGIRAVESQLIENNGKEAVAAREIRGATSVYLDELRSSADVQSGFVADAFLANRDVIGLTLDNCVRGEDGNVYRIDNGGSMIFKAMGGDKEYAPDKIEELVSMREHRPAKDVFEGLTDAEAQHLIDNLSEDDIRRFVNESGLEGQERERVLNGMLGRREYLVRLCKGEERLG